MHSGVDQILSTDDQSEWFNQKWQSARKHFYLEISSVAFSGRCCDNSICVQNKLICTCSVLSTATDKTVCMQMIRWTLHVIWASRRCRIVSLCFVFEFITLSIHSKVTTKIQSANNSKMFLWSIAVDGIRIAYIHAVIAIEIFAHVFCHRNDILSKVAVVNSR